VKTPGSGPGEKISYFYFKGGVNGRL